MSDLEYPDFNLGLSISQIPSPSQSPLIEEFTESDIELAQLDLELNLEVEKSTEHTRSTVVDDKDTPIPPTRFPTVSKEQVDDILTASTSKNTQKSTASHVKIFRGKIIRLLFCRIL